MYFWKIFEKINNQKDLKIVKIATVILATMSQPRRNHMDVWRRKEDDEEDEPEAKIEQVDETKEGGANAESVEVDMKGIPILAHHFQGSPRWIRQSRITTNQYSNIYAMSVKLSPDADQMAFTLGEKLFYFWKFEEVLKKIDIYIFQEL